MDISPSNEAMIRLSCFVVVFAALAALEAGLPRRSRDQPRASRWLGNVGVSAINQLVLRLLLPASAIALAIHAENSGWGLFGAVDFPSWVEVIAAVLILDLVIYVQHVVYHAVPLLWRFHRMHHADTEFDLTTGIRFHPGSVLLSGFIKLAAVLVLGPAPIAVLIFEIILNATSLFNHSNLRLPDSLDRVLRLLVVTPDMHRVHHSSDPDETDRNFGFNFPWWDRVFRTYRAQPALGHVRMVIGLTQFREPRERLLGRMLTQPFRSE